MTAGTLQVIPSRHLVNQLIRNLADPRFRLAPPVQRRIVCRLPRTRQTVRRRFRIRGMLPRPKGYARPRPGKIWQRVDAILTTDMNPLDLDGDYSFRIIRPNEMLAIIADTG